MNLFGYADSLVLKMLICDPDKVVHGVIIVLSIIADYHHGFVHRCVPSVICDNGVNCCLVVRPMGTLGLVLEVTIVVLCIVHAKKNTVFGRVFLQQLKLR